jgi:hypothetical protein
VLGLTATQLLNMVVTFKLEKQTFLILLASCRLVVVLLLEATA